jgi:hypothetical protein
VSAKSDRTDENSACDRRPRLGARTARTRPPRPAGGPASGRVEDRWSRGLLVATERLGWPAPSRGWRRWVPRESQSPMVYGDGPGEPSGTCHLQLEDRENSLCGFPWEGLVVVPGSPACTDLHPEMRCPKAAKWPCHPYGGTDGSGLSLPMAGRSEDAGRRPDNPAINLEMD